MSNCKNICKLCPRLVISDSVSVVTVDGTDTLLIDIPQRAYNNCEKYCIIVAQSIPTTATVLMPVAISIGGNTTTVYPLENPCGEQINACGIRTRTKYSTRVITNATGGVFRLLGNVCCYPATNLTSLPAPTASVLSATASARPVATSTTAVKKTSTPKSSTVDTMTVNASNVTVKKEDK